MKKIKRIRTIAISNIIVRGKPKLKWNVAKISGKIKPPFNARRIANQNFRTLKEAERYAKKIKNNRNTKIVYS